MHFLGNHLPRHPHGTGVVSSRDAGLHPLSSLWSHPYDRCLVAQSLLSPRPGIAGHRTFWIDHHRSRQWLFSLGRTGDPERHGGAVRHAFPILDGRHGGSGARRRPFARAHYRWHAHRHDGNRASGSPWRNSAWSERPPVCRLSATTTRILWLGHWIDSAAAPADQGSPGGERRNSATRYRRCLPDSGLRLSAFAGALDCARLGRHRLPGDLWLHHRL